MTPVDDTSRASRSIAASTLAIIGLILAVGVTLLVLLARNKGSLLRSAEIAGDYHLASTVRAATIARLLEEIDRPLRRLDPNTSPTEAHRSAASMLPRVVYLIDREMKALVALHRKYAQPEFDASLDRLNEQYDRLAGARLDIRGMSPAQAEAAVLHLDPLRLRLDQFSGLHWNAYLTHDKSAERAAGWRRFSMLSIMVAGVGLIPIGVATRQILNAVRDRRRTEQRRRLMQAELDHRVRNNLAAVLSLTNQTVRASTDLDDFADAFTGRIVAMSRTHEALARAKWTGIDLARAAAWTLAAHLDAEPPRIAIQGDSVILPAEAAMPVCLVLHELSTNAVKHGALSRPDGRVALSWTRRPNAIDLSWVEHGGPATVEPESVGLGTQLIEGFVRHELRGTVTMDYRPDGLQCRLALPLDDDAGSRPAVTVEDKPAHPHGDAAAHDLAERAHGPTA